jgi:hypothetical protein
MGKNAHEGNNANRLIKSKKKHDLIPLVNWFVHSTGLDRENLQGFAPVNRVAGKYLTDISGRFQKKQLRGREHLKPVAVPIS